MTEPRSTTGRIDEISPRTSTSSNGSPMVQPAGNTTTAGSKFVAGWQELTSDIKALTADLETYRDAPTSEFVDLDDVD